MADVKVEYNFLGKSGIKVSNLCLGTMTFGQNPKYVFNNPRQINEHDSHQILDKFASYGGNFIDTADIYSHGLSEEIVGNWLQRRGRDQFIVATKVRSQMDRKNVNAVGLSRRHLVEACEQSLERLQTNYIDLYQSHTWDAAIPIDETLRAFDDLIRCGKIRYFGVSNACGWQLQKIVDRLKAMGLSSCVSLQFCSLWQMMYRWKRLFKTFSNDMSHDWAKMERDIQNSRIRQQYNLICRQSELEEFVVCKNEGIGVLPWSPLKGGLLTGKYQTEKTLDGTSTRLGFAQTKKLFLQITPNIEEYSNNEGYRKLMTALFETGQSHGKTIAQVAIRWLLQKKEVTSVIIGVTSLKQLDDNIGAATGWKLSLDEMQRLDETSGRLTPYPYDVIKRLAADRLNPFHNSTNQLL